MTNHGGAENPTTLLCAVRSIRRVTPRVVELLLESSDQQLRYQPGQYVLLSDPAGDVPPRSYSLAAAPSAGGTLRLLVARAPGGAASGWVHDVLQVGDTTVVDGPYGNFIADPCFAGPLLYLAAGCGIAPVLALLEAEVEKARSPSRPITLLVSAREDSELIDRNRLLRWRDRGLIRFERTVTRDPLAIPPRGRLPEQLHRLVGELSDYQVYICGGDGFVAACEGAARSCGASAGSIHSEIFFSDPVPWSTTGRGAA